MNLVLKNDALEILEILGVDCKVYVGDQWHFLNFEQRFDDLGSC